METQVWSKVDDKMANLLTLRGTEIHRLRVTGSMLTFKRNLGKVMEALEQGKAPGDCGAKVLETLDARTIRKAELSPGNSSLTLHGGDEAKPISLAHSTGDSNANVIFDAIMQRSGKTFEPTQEEIGVGEALVPPGILALLGGGGVAAIYFAANDMANGEDVEVKGFRRRGLKRILITVAETIGTTGAIALGALLLVIVVAWAVRRITHRPMRTVWTPASAAAMA